MSRRHSFIAVLSALLLSSCASDDLSYLIRAAYEEARILARRRPIAEMLADDEVTPEMRAKLELVLMTRTFAAERLGLLPGGSYSSVATVDQDQIVHVVSAAYRDRLQPYTWWFPIVGDVPYRGYFAPSAASELAKTLEAEGYDTYVRRALAFSTLGYFDDPLLSHLLRSSDEELVETILHELLHTTVYFAGQATFNESFANFVGHRGAIAFFAEKGRAANEARARERWQDALQFGELLTTILSELETAYAAGIDDDERAGLFASARTHFAERSWRTNEFDGFVEGPINNAVLLARRVYFDRLEVFEDVAARFDGDLPRTIDWLIAAARSDADAFRGIAAALSGIPDESDLAMRRRSGGPLTVATRLDYRRP